MPAASRCKTDSLLLARSAGQLKSAKHAQTRKETIMYVIKSGTRVIAHGSKDYVSMIQTQLAHEGIMTVLYGPYCEDVES